MSKSRRASSPGSIGSGHRLYRLRRGTKRTRDLSMRPRPLLEGHICVASSAVNRVFCKFVAVRRLLGSGRRLTFPRLLSRQAWKALLQGSKASDFKRFWGKQLKRSEYRRAWRRPPPRYAPSGASRDRRSTRFPGFGRPRRRADDGFGAGSSMPMRPARRYSNRP